MTLKKDSLIGETNFAFTKSKLLALCELVVQAGITQVECCDTGSIGLRAIIYACSRIVFYSRYSYRKRRHLIKHADLGVMTIEQARVANNAIRLQIAQGIDPKAARKIGITLEKFAHNHFLPFISGRKSYADDESKIQRLLKAFGRASVADMKSPDLVIFLRDLQYKSGLTPATANRYLATIKALFRFATESEIISRNIAKDIKPQPENNERTRCLSDRETPAFLQAVRNYEVREIGLLLELLLFSGARLGEALAAKIEDINLSAGSWHLPTSKSGKSANIYLSQPAKDVLVELISRRRSDYLFAGQKGNDTLSRPGNQFATICKRAGIVGLRIHDLRRSWATTGIESDVPIFILQKGLRHSTQKMTERYLSLKPDALIAANETIGKRINEK